MMPRTNDSFPFSRRMTGVITVPSRAFGKLACRIGERSEERDAEVLVGVVGYIPVGPLPQPEIGDRAVCLESKFVQEPQKWVMKAGSRISGKTGHLQAGASPSPPWMNSTTTDSLILRRRACSTCGSNPDQSRATGPVSTSPRGARSVLHHSGPRRAIDRRPQEADRNRRRRGASPTRHRGGDRSAPAGSAPTPRCSQPAGPPRPTRVGTSNQQRAGHVQREASFAIPRGDRENVKRCSSVSGMGPPGAVSVGVRRRRVRVPRDRGHRLHR